MSFLLSKASQIAREPGDPQVLETGPSSLKGIDKVGRALGWASFGLGALELFAPKTVTKWLGMEGREGLVRAYGVREFGAGVMCLSTNNDYGAFNRAAGDVLDLATLATAYRDDNPKKRNVGLAIAAVAAIGVIDAATGWAIRSLHKRKGEPRDFSDRSGFPKGIAYSRGKAAGQVPPDYRAAPAAVQASPVGSEASPAARAMEREPA
ncbi:MAG TPA: hypothetical protein VIV07_02520 [Sphingomicrobium sp.]